MYVSIIKKFIVVLCSTMLLSMALPTRHSEAAMAQGSKFVGNIIAGSVPSNFATYWNQVTPENATKWGSVEGSRNSMNWSNADLIYNYSRTNGIPFKFHTLVWGSQEPTWIDSLSAADQKAEVTEWIRAAGQRYPNAEFVDVVNEPLHAPASFRNALGGSGSTGWDWVVWSFEQARQAFPNSKLLINDYGIISDPNAANNYVQIINILKSKGLIDGIGIQCHYFNMDTVSVSTMNQVLGILGATGLPIYVSELDMTGDDTTQLNRYKEKFPVLYESQYVKGITLWGYIEGQTWASNTHLISSSGVERPALAWLKQYLASPPTSRSAFTQIEAESYSTQSGIQTESSSEGGQNVGWIENGDYVVYNNIDFGSGAASFQARVASATNGGNIEVRLDSITGTLAGTCAVSGTGGWQNWTTTTCNISGASGVHNVYLKFTGGSGYLFNLNWFQFFTNNLITNPGLETGNTAGWAVNGAGSIAVSTAQKRSGAYSLLSTGRTATWNGPIQNITSKVQSGRTYTCSGWVRLDNAASSSVIMTIKKVDGSGTSYTNVAAGTGSNSSWVQLSGNYTLNVTGTLTELSIYFEGPNSGTNFYIDDVSVQ
ncbi:carbohydrate-binding protein [Cohnella sp. CFH 77786]|nr:carbohydrate-binding protein [Cohnella sp. CFH 77786]